MWCRDAANSLLVSVLHVGTIGALPGCVLGSRRRPEAAVDPARLTDLSPSGLACLLPNLCSGLGAHRLCGARGHSLLCNILLQEFIMADPRETWQKLQNALQQRRAASGGFPGGGPKNAAGAVLFIGIGLASYVAYNSLYTGAL